MPYNRELEFPQLKKEHDGSCTYTHNHAYSYSFTADKWTLKTRKQARDFLDEGKKEMHRCIFFARNCLKDDSLTGVQKAILEQSIKNDEDLIQTLENVKPSRCTIL